VLLPCNVVVQELEDGKVEVSMVNPMESMQAVQNPALGEVAAEVSDRMSQALAKL
jgi:uncharacterized protein (DUF302 family)